MSYLPQYAPLNKAVRSGDWEAARKFLDDNPEAVTARISIEGKTALHIAAFHQLTALHEATYSRIIEVAKCLVKKNSNLLAIPNTNGLILVTHALNVGHKEMARYLYSVTPWEELTPGKGNHGTTLLNLC